MGTWWAEPSRTDVWFVCLLFMPCLGCVHSIMKFVTDAATGRRRDYGARGEGVSVTYIRTCIGP